MDLLQQQNMENALYTIDSSPFGRTAKEIWESIGFVFKRDFQELTVEEFAYKRMHYRYQFTTSEAILMEDIESLTVYEVDLDYESAYFIAVEVSYTGSEKQKIEQAKYIADFLTRISNRHCHFLFKIGVEICFTSLIQIEKREEVFKHANLRKKGNKVLLPQYEYKFITSELFSFFMDKDKWDILYSISMEDYVASFVREVEIANYSAEYIIYELEPVANGYKMLVGELNLYCKNVMYELFGDEWFTDNHVDYADEIRKEKLSDEDWDLIEFELEGQEDNSIHEDDTWNEEWDEDIDEEDEFDEIPDDVVDDPVALLEWLDSHKKVCETQEQINYDINTEANIKKIDTNVLLYSSLLFEIRLMSIKLVDEKLCLKVMQKNKSAKRLSAWIQSVYIEDVLDDTYRLFSSRLEPFQEKQGEYVTESICKGYQNRLQFIFEIDNDDNEDLEESKEITIYCDFKSGHIDVKGFSNSATNLQNQHGTLETLLESVDYRLPIDVHKDNWTSDYHFVITSVRNGYAYGDIYIGNRYKKQSSYPIDKHYHTYTFYQG